MPSTSTRERIANPTAYVTESIVHEPPGPEAFAARALSARIVPGGPGPQAALPVPQGAPKLPDGETLPGGEPARGKLAPYLALLARMVETRPRAMIKDLHLLLREKGYSGSYDLVKKKVQAIRRGLGRQAGALFASAEAPYAQVEMTRILLRNPGPASKAYLCTMVLGHSGRCYAELIARCELDAFLRFHGNAFAFLGGVPGGVFYNTRENPGLRRLAGGYPFHLPLVDCARHYGFTAHPTPAFAPWMKGRLKRPGKILQKLFFPGYAVRSLEQANADMREWMAHQDGFGDRKPDSRPERLRPLPGTGFDPKDRRQFLRLRA